MGREEGKRERIAGISRVNKDGWRKEAGELGQ